MTATSRPTIVIAGQPYEPTVPTSLVAELMGCSCEWLQKAAQSGDLPAGLVVHRLGTRLRWATTSVAEALGLPFEVRHVAATLPDPVLAQVTELRSGAEPGGPLNGERPGTDTPDAATDSHYRSKAVHGQVT